MAGRTGAKRTRGRQERKGENRARLGFAMTNGRRGHRAPPFVSIQETTPTLDSVEYLSLPGHLIRPPRGSSSSAISPLPADPNLTLSFSPGIYSGLLLFPFFRNCAGEIDVFRFLYLLPFVPYHGITSYDVGKLMWLSKRGGMKRSR